MTSSTSQSQSTSSPQQTTVMIGLEIHAYLKTESKLFCACSTNGVEPNTACCPVCLGHPGAKPVLNELAIDLASRIALALGCTINNTFFFSRKTYFYPDMSMNYQITQYEVPLAEKGALALSSSKEVRIRRVHMEWDPAALVHPDGMGESNHVLIDYNRSGLALVEIVTEPDLASPKEAREFLSALENTLSYLNVLKNDTTLKVDCNVSINGGNKVEIKNISGFAAAEKALTYEIARQKQKVSQGEIIEQHTRAFNAEKEITVELRKKETEDDYGYIFDPDLVMMELTHDDIARIQKAMPELPGAKATRLQKEFGLSAYDAQVLCGNFGLGKLFDALVVTKANPLIASRLLTREILAILNHDSLVIEQISLDVLALGELIALIEQNKVSDKNAKQALINYISGDHMAPVVYLEKNALLISATIDIDSIVKKIITQNEKAVADYKAGNQKSLNFLSGLVMREARGAVSPQKVQETLTKFLASA